MSAKRACGLVGCGTVGSGVVRLWNEAGHAPRAPLKTVAVRNPAKARTVDLAGITLTGDALALARDPEIGVVIEATGDAALAHELALECFRRGKSFVTAGKEMVARSGPELEAVAQASGVAFRYEAAVGGALPVVALLSLGLAPGAVRGFEGVLNGTCNFILSHLDRGLSFAEALELATAEGFAESDSRRDTSGRDTAEKLVILARLCGVRLDPDALAVRGIEGLHPEDAAFGRRRGWSLRLVASFRDEDETALASVAPAFVPRDSFLAQARDEENAVVLDAGSAGTLGLVGRGAGSLPTASAVLADVREVLRGGTDRPAAPPRRPRRILTEDAAPARHYVRVDGPEGSCRSLTTALDAAGLAVDVLTSPRPGRLQVVTAPAETVAVRRVVASITVRESLVIPVRDRTPVTPRATAGAVPRSSAAKDAAAPEPVPSHQHEAIEGREPATLTA